VKLHTTMRQTTRITKIFLRGGSMQANGEILAQRTTGDLVRPLCRLYSFSSLCLHGSSFPPFSSRFAFFHATRICAQFSSKIVSQPDGGHPLIFILTTTLHLVTSVKNISPCSPSGNANEHERKPGHLAFDD
jgi:hypothetical protein